MDIVQRIRSRVNDAPLSHEYMLDDAADEIERLRDAIVMADNRLEVADCPLCIDVARSYLKDALGQTASG